ncbi:MAG: M20/M25/M40 family metallo-hydrolase [Albidovulum sp.]|nr:M20/M25/M40 family metallo-hydrolase [Albidovulum sp.]
MLKTLAQLVSAQEGGEAAVQGCISNFLEAAGCEVEQFQYQPSSTRREREFGRIASSDFQERTVVAGRLRGSPELPSLIAFAHPDTESPFGLDQLNTDPFSAKSHRGRIYGWGVADDLAGCAAGLAAIDEISSFGAPRGDIVFASAPSKRSARGIVEYLDRRRADACLYLHPAESGNGMKEIKAASPGQLQFEFHIPGQPPDTSEPCQTPFSHLGRNPVDDAIALCECLANFAEERCSRIRYPPIEERVGRSTNLHVSEIRTGAEGDLSRIPDHCILGGAICFPPVEDLAEVMREFERATCRFNEADERRRSNPVSLSWISGSSGAEIKESHPLYRIAHEAIENSTGTAPEYYPLHAASDIRFPIALHSIPCVGFGCLAGNLANNGFANEWVGIESYFQMIEASMRIMASWSSGEWKLQGTQKN